MANVLANQAKSRHRVTDTLAGTGSNLDAAGIDLYQRLFSAPRHVQTALQMMAGWDLAPLVRTFPTLTTPLVLIVAGGDRAVPPEQGGLVADQVKSARVVYLRNLGHLAHEEAPDDVANLILDVTKPWLSLQP
jgi:magnesium chelatase accessory protein